MIRFLVSVLLVLTCAKTATSQMYRQGDWVSFGVFRFVSAITVGQHYAYFGTTGGVSRYDLFKGKWADPLTTSDGLPDNQITAVAVDQVFNDLWLATPRGVGRYSDTSRKCTVYLSGGGQLLTDVQSIGTTWDGLIIFESPTGLATFDVSSQAWEAMQQMDLALLQSRTEIRWSGRKGSRLYNYPRFLADPAYLFEPPDYISDRRTDFPLTGFQEDRSRTLWIATWGLNVGKASLRDWHLTMERIGLYTPNVTAITADGDDLWFGCQEDPFPFELSMPVSAPFRENGGVTRYNRKTAEWTYYIPSSTDGLPTGYVNAIVADSSTVWFGTDEGLVGYQKTTNRWYPFSTGGMTSTHVTAVALTDKEVWIGTDHGINRLDRLTRSIKPVNIKELRAARIFDLAVDDGRTLWAGTDRGVFLHTGSGAWQKIEDPDTHTLSGAVFDVEVEADTLWFAVETSLLRYNRKSGVWKSYLLPLSVGEYPIRMKNSDRFIWLGGRNGAARFEKHTERWKVFTDRDGLIDETVQSIFPDGHYVWFGTPRGVTRFFWNDPSRTD